LATTYIASLPDNGKRDEYVVPSFRPKSGSNELIVKKGSEEQSQVRLTYSGETKYNADEARAMNALGEALSIKLIEKLREEEGGVYGAGARGSINKIPYGSYNFSISFPCAPENVDKLINASIAEVQKMIDNGPTDEDLEKVKKAKLLSRKDQLEQNRFWLSLIRNADYNKSNLDNVLTYEKDINALTKKDLQNVAKKYLTKGYFKAVLYPEDK